MSVHEALKQAADFGVKITLNGDGVALKAHTKPPPELLAKLKHHKAEIVALLRNDASRPEPRIVREPPFGSDKVPERYLAAWHALLAQCPPSAKPIVWEAAIYDAATLFGDFGTLLVEYGWTAGDLFDVPCDGRPGGLAWFIHGSPVMAIGRKMAQTQDGRIWHRLKNLATGNP